MSQHLHPGWLLLLLPRQGNLLEWGGGQQFRRREDILYNIFMIETEDTGGRHLGWSWGRAASGEPHYGRLASLDVSLLEPGKREDNYF